MTKTAPIPLEFKKALLRAAENAYRDIAGQLAGEYLNRANTAKWLGISPAYLDRLTTTGMPYHNIDGHRLWHKPEVRSWLDKYKRQ